MATTFIVAVIISTVWLAQGSWDICKANNVLGLPDTSPLQGVSGPVLPDELNNIQYHGTTTLAFIRDECVVICVDSKASVGSYVGSRGVKKVFPVSKSVVATMAGGAADCAYWIRRIATALRSLEYKYAASFNAKAIARTLASSLRQYRGMGLSVGTMVAGWENEVGPSLFYVDSEGACIGGDMFCVGSGAQFAYAILDTAGSQEDSKKKTAAKVAEPLPAQIAETGSHTGTVCQSVSSVQRLTSKRTQSALATMPLSRAIDTAVQAVRHATYRDGFSGGYINVLLVNASGIHHVRRVDSRSIPI